MTLDDKKGITPFAPEKAAETIRLDWSSRNLMDGLYVGLEKDVGTRIIGSIPYSA